MELGCQTDLRREAVRCRPERVGLDYVEVDSDDRCVLRAYFLGALPKELTSAGKGLERHVAIEGGDRITGLGIVDVDVEVAASPELDSVLVVRVDRPGDRSSYALRLVDIANVDPRYATATFSFAVCCPSDLDCKPQAGCEPELLDEPQLNYLAKDYASFRQLMLDRLAILMPDWTERHAADLGVTLVELLAYVADQLSYYQDAIATEAYIGTARQRISMRRHARLVDYALHEGCNARTWLHAAVSGDVELPAAKVAFVTGREAVERGAPSVLPSEALRELPEDSYELFEPLLQEPGAMLRWKHAHNRISIYTWGNRECCLPAGATRATLRDAWVQPDREGPVTRALALQAGDVLLFEEVLGAKTGVEADADLARRWPVRLVRVTPDEDTLFVKQGRATPLLHVEWSAADALPFAFCLSSVGRAPECRYLEDVSVARANMLLVDHGRTLDPEALPAVPEATATPCCECEGQPSPLERRPGRYRPTLAHGPLVFSEAVPDATAPAMRCLSQDPRAAVPQLRLSGDASVVWLPRPDLIASGPDDRAFVVETDNQGTAHLRFGDGELGRQPQPGAALVAHYRSGGGTRGNVGPESIARVVLKQLTLSGVELRVRNPLAAIGGTAPEPIEEVRLFAPLAFRRERLRAITADDYAEIAARNPKLQRASAELVWTGSWYEADVAYDPLAAASADSSLAQEIAAALHRVRRMGHDVHVEPARYVPIKLALEVCVRPGYDRGHVKAALLERFSNRSTRGVRGFFHPDALSFGDSIYLSKIVAAAQGVVGVQCATVTALQRQFSAPNRELDSGVLALAHGEIAQLDNDPDHPERGQLTLVMKGGRS